MKNTAKLLFGILIFILFSCKEDPLQITPEELPTILDYNETVNLSTNLDADWVWTEASGGEISNTGVLTIGDSSGVFVLEAISKSDESNRASIQIRVSNRAQDLNPLLSGGHVIYLRHAIAKEGEDLFDNGPEGWHKSCEESIARQLSPEGRTQAQALGRTFISLGIPFADTVYVSEFCRCIQTVELLDLGLAMATREEITYYVYDDNLRHERTKTLIDQFPVTDKNLLIVSHSFGPGSDYPQVQQGYTAIFTGGNTGPTFKSIIRDDEWIVLE